MTLPYTDDELAIITEIESDCYGDDSLYDDCEPDFPPCDCGQLATGWSESGATCDDCYRRDLAAFRASLPAHDGSVVYAEEMPGVGFPF